jgi:hypothetical protein
MANQPSFASETVFDVCLHSDSQTSKTYKVCPLGYPVPSLLFISRLTFFRAPRNVYGNSGSTNMKFMDASRMAEEFKQLMTFYFVDASVSVTDNGTSATLNYPGKGVPFRSQVSCATLDQILPDPHTRISIHALFPNELHLVPDCPNIPGIYPVMSIHHTRFACGGVCLGFRMSHVFGDGKTLIDLCQHWTRVESLELENSSDLTSLYNSFEDTVYSKSSVEDASVVVDTEDVEKRNIDNALGSTNNHQHLVSVPSIIYSSEAILRLNQPKHTIETKSLEYRLLSAEDIALSKQVPKNLGPTVFGRLLFSKDDQINIQRLCRTRTSLPISRVEAFIAHLTLEVYRARCKVFKVENQQVQVDVIYDVRNFFESLPSTTLVGNFNMPIATRLVPNLYDMQTAIADLSKQLHQRRKQLPQIFQQNYAWLQTNQQSRHAIVNTCLGMCIPGHFNLCFSPMHRAEMYTKTIFQGSLLDSTFTADIKYPVDGLVLITETAALNGEMEVSIGLLKTVWDELIMSHSLFPLLPSKL